jgi:hypothetical protein
MARIQVYSKTLDAQLGAAPVPALIVVPVWQQGRIDHQIPATEQQIKF